MNPYQALLAAACAVTLSTSVTADAADVLPKSGTINVHSGYWAVSDSVTVAEKHAQGHGSNRGVIYNDLGSGPFHLGPTDCFFTFDMAGDFLKVRGHCTFGDTDGDRVFSEFDGATLKDGAVGGMHDILGGTGKFAGITGKIGWRCKYVGSNGELSCTQKIDYKLP